MKIGKLMISEAEGRILGNLLIMVTTGDTDAFEALSLHSENLTILLGLGPKLSEVHYAEPRKPRK